MDLHRKSGYPYRLSSLHGAGPFVTPIFGKTRSKSPLGNCCSVLINEESLIYLRPGAAGSLVLKHLHPIRLSQFWQHPCPVGLDVTSRPPHVVSSSDPGQCPRTHQGLALPREHVATSPLPTCRLLTTTQLSCSAAPSQSGPSPFLPAHPYSAHHSPTRFLIYHFSFLLEYKL